jgi:hypothetical protein
MVRAAGQSGRHRHPGVQPHLPWHRGIAAYLENGSTLEKARQMAHASTRTTQLYDWREDRGTLDEVVRINIRG